MQDQRIQTSRFKINKLEERIAPSNANFPPGQFPSQEGSGVGCDADRLRLDNV